MRLSDWASIATIVQCFSLLFVAWQLYENIRFNKATSSNRLYSQDMKITLELVKNPSMLSLQIKGRKEFNLLNDDEKEQYLRLLHDWLSSYENAYIYRKSIFNKESYAVYENGLIELISIKGVSDRWGMLREYFNPKFRCYVDELIARTRRESPPQRYITPKKRHPG